MKFKNIIFIAFLYATSVSFLYPHKALAATADCPEVDKAGAAALEVMTTTWASMKLFFAEDAAAVPAAGKAQSNAAAKGTAETTSASAWDQFILPLGKCAAYKAGQIALDKLTKDTVTWIQSGMNGSPYYAVDTNQLGIDLADAVAGNLASQIQSYELCDFSTTWKNDLANWMIMGEAEPAPVFRAALKCPLDPITASEFYSGVQEFTWETFETALSDNGNPFGVTVIAGNELNKRQRDEAARAKRQLDWGQGFMGVIDETSCKWPDEMTEQAVMNGAAYDTDTGAVLTDEQKAAYKRGYCKTVTPAVAISHQLTKATDVDWDRLGLQDDLTKITNAIITHYSQEMVKGIFKK